MSFQFRLAGRDLGVFELLGAADYSIALLTAVEMCNYKFQLSGFPQTPTQADRV